MFTTPEHFTRRSFLACSRGLLGAAIIGVGQPQVSLGKAADDPLAKVVSEFYAAYEQLNVEKFLKPLTDDCFFEDPTFHLVARGKLEIKKMFEDVVPRLSNVKIDLENRIVCPNWVVTQQSLSGDFKRRSGGGGKFSVRGATIFGFRDGKINRWIDYYDFDTWQKQTRPVEVKP